MTAGFHILDGLPGEAENWVVDINDAGYIVGNSAVNIGGIEEPWFQTRGFLWHNGTVTALTMADGTPITTDMNHSCHYVNQSGQVIGQFEYYLNPGDAFSVRRAVLWDDGATTILDDGMSFGEAIGINDNGEVVGRWGEGREVFLYCRKPPTVWKPACTNWPPRPTGPWPTRSSPTASTMPARSSAGIPRAANTCPTRTVEEAGSTPRACCGSGRTVRSRTSPPLMWMTPTSTSTARARWPAPSLMSCGMTTGITWVGPSRDAAGPRPTASRS